MSPLILGLILGLFVACPILVGKAIKQGTSDTPHPPRKDNPVAIVTVNVTNPEFRQRVIFETVNLWDVTVTREHFDACEDYLATRDLRVLDSGDPPVRGTIDALVNGYWYVDGGPSTHPQAGQPLTFEGGTGWEYECFWIHEDDLEGHTLADLGDGARHAATACQWLLDAWKTHGA